MKRIQMMMCPLLFSLVAACTADPTINPTTTPGQCVGLNCPTVVGPACPGPDPRCNGVVCPGPDPRCGGGSSGVVLPPACAMDTRQVVQSQDGHYIEVITSHGVLYEFENGVPVQPDVGSIYAPAGYPSQPAVAPTVAGPVHVGTDLSSIPLYATGPCLGLPGPLCVFDTQAFVLLPEGRFLEYVTVGDRQFVFEDEQMTGAGVPLESIPRYAEVCAFAQLNGGICQFDTRTFTKSGNDVIEWITAYGKMFKYNIDGIRLPDSGTDLMAIHQYATGPCLGQAPGFCQFDTQTFELSGGVLVESVTARGLLFRFHADSGAPLGIGVPISSALPYLASACF